MKLALSLVAAASCLSTALADHHKALEKIVAPDTKVEKLGGDMVFTEGPVWIPAQKMVVFSDIPNSRQMKWTKEGGLKEDRKSTRLNSSHKPSSYAVFCLKKKI